VWWWCGSGAPSPSPAAAPSPASSSTPSAPNLRGSCRRPRRCVGCTRRCARRLLLAPNPLAPCCPALFLSTCPPLLLSLLCQILGWLQCYVCVCVCVCLYNITIHSPVTVHAPQRRLAPFCFAAPVSGGVGAISAPDARRALPFFLIFFSSAPVSGGVGAISALDASRCFYSCRERRPKVARCGAGLTLPPCCCCCSCLNPAAAVALA
jgi:hypothetical protein